MFDLYNGIRDYIIHTYFVIIIYYCNITVHLTACSIKMFCYSKIINSFTCLV